MVRVKICGITCEEDARLAVECGADAIGVLVGQKHPSTDFVSAEEAGTILASVPPFIAATLVTHHDDVERIADLISIVRPHVVQLHSQMLPRDCATLKERFGAIRFIKAYIVVDAHSLDYGDRYLDVVDGFHLDSMNRSTGQVGGTGLTHDWNLSAAIVRRYRTSVILAGGLSPANVKAAIAQVRPYGVDVNSGVKAGPGGRKDADKLRDFIDRAKNATAR